MTPLQNDITGVVLAVVAVAMFVSVVAPSGAVLTSAVGQGLMLCFGAGAILFPIALFVFAMTFFMDGDGPVSGRVAGGLTLIVLAVLAMLSLNLPGAEADPSVVLEPANLELAGGYVGGIVAFGLVRLVGVIVGNVVLVGLIAAGVVVCGFSISNAVSKAQVRLGEASEARRERREERAAERESAKAVAAEARTMARNPQASLFDEAGEGETSYIGARKTSVLRREDVQPTGPKGGAAEDAADLPWATDDDAPTTLLGEGAFAEESAAPVEDAGDGGDKPKGRRSRRTTKPTRRRGSKAERDPEESGKTLVASVLDADAGKKASAASQAADATAAAAEATADAPQGSVPTFLSGGAAGPKAPKDLTRPGDGDGTYKLPPFSLLKTSDPNAATGATNEELESTAAKLQGTLEEFGLKSRVVGWVAGPAVTTFRIAMGEGERVNKITNLEDDIALSLAARSVRIFAPIPGTSLVGIEIPNEKPQPVNLADVLPYAKGGPLECAFGRDSEGRPIVIDLSGLPHLLVAGTTGSGKSVLLNSLVMSMLMRATPEQVRLIMVDPKRVEFTGYAGLPHLYVPVVTEPRQAASALQWAVTEMERRLKVFEHYKVRDIKTYNRKCDRGEWEELENPPKHMPYFVIVIDELADLMMVAGKDVEGSIVRIAQLGRAAGIHLIVATQRPSADVVTGLIRANIDNRVALSVDNSLNSRIILDQKGAEQLMGKGDMLVKVRGKKPRRAQGCWVSDEEIASTVKFIREQVSADYHTDILTAATPVQPGGASTGAPSDDDPLLWEAAQVVVDSQLGSTSGLQRALAVGYARAGRIMDMLESKGVVGPQNGSKPREVLLDRDGLDELKAAEAAYQGVE